jgi:hypothetical protein
MREQSSFALSLYVEARRSMSPAMSLAGWTALFYGWSIAAAASLRPF